MKTLAQSTSAFVQKKGVVMTCQPKRTVAGVTPPTVQAMLWVNTEPSFESFSMALEGATNADNGRAEIFVGAGDDTQNPEGCISASSIAENWIITYKGVDFRVTSNVPEGPFGVPAQWRINARRTIS